MVVYIQNLLPNSRQPKAILAELWIGQCQDISYLQPFGCTLYAHILLDLSFSKLNPRSVKTALLGYFGHNGYKLLNKNTGTIFKSRNVIFKEETTHLAKQPTSTVLSDNNDPFADKPQQNDNIIGPSDDPKPEPTPPPIHGITPRPLASSNLHKNKDKECIIPDIDDSNSTMTKDKQPNIQPDNLLLALRRF